MVHDIEKGAKLTIIKTATEGPRRVTLQAAP
jgi:hypothetical protein